MASNKKIDHEESPDWTSSSIKAYFLRESLTFTLTTRSHEQLLLHAQCLLIYKNVSFLTLFQIRAKITENLLFEIVLARCRLSPKHQRKGEKHV